MHRTQHHGHETADVFILELILGGKNTLQIFIVGYVGDSPASRSVRRQNGIAADRNGAFFFELPDVFPNLLVYVKPSVEMLWLLHIRN